MRYFTTLLGLLVVFSVFAVNEDTPNLSFENGDFEGWTLYDGDYYHNTDENTLEYEWIENPASSRIKIMSTVKGTMDPTIQCGSEGEEFFINPDGVPVVRLGVPNKSEGLFDRSGRIPRCQQLKAKAERMVYKFIVTERTSLLTYKFALVLADPATENDGHVGEELPQFIFRINSKNPTTGAEKALSCSEYVVKVGAPDLIKNTRCPLSSTNQGNAATIYKYKNWTTGAIDLSSHIGNEITIEVITHDCLVRNLCNGVETIMAGGHESWGYFWAETKELSLITKNCESENPQLIAPEGFSKYTWSRSDGLNNIFKTPNPDEPWIVEVDQSNIVEGVTYQCNLGTEFCGTEIELKSDLDKITINPGFTTKDSCSGQINFFNNSTIIGDNIESYIWDFGDTTYSSLKNPVHKYEKPGNYVVKLTVRTSLGCEKSIEQNVVVNYFPELQIDGKTKFCKGDIIDLEVLEAETGSKFLWSTGDDTQKIQTIATESKFYTVKVTDRHSCEYEKEIYVSVYEKPTVRIRGEEKVCYGDTAILIASGAINYSWNTGSKNDTLKAKPLESTTYTVTGYANNGCPGTATVTVSILPLPTITIEGVDELCQDKPSKLVAKGGETYIWSDLFSGKEREIISNTPGYISFDVVGTDANNCSSKATKIVNIKANPIIELIGDSIVCQGDVAKLSAYGADTWMWHDNSTTNMYSLKIETPVNWSVTGTTEGCTATASRTIYVKKPSNVWINGDTEICEGDTLKLTAVGGKSYNWSNGSNTDSLVALPTQSTGYQLTAIASNDCSVTKNIDIIVHKKPVIDITGMESICVGNYVKLVARNINGDAKTFQWSNGARGDSIDLLIEKETEITVSGIDNYMCVGKASHYISLKEPPTLTYEGDTAICPGEKTRIIVKGATSYEWGHGGTSSVLEESPTDYTMYTVKGTLAGCVATLAIQVTIKDKPNIFISGDSRICPGETFTLVAEGANTYQWNTGDTGNSITKSQNSTTTYVVTGTTENGCSNKESFVVEVLPLPNIKIEMDNFIGCPNTLDTVRLTATGGEKYTWSSEISLPEIENYPNAENLMVLVENETKIFLEGQDENGCINYDEVFIKKFPRQTLSFEVEPILIEKSNPVIHFKGNTPINSKWIWKPNVTEQLTLEGNSVVHNYGSKGLTDSIIVSILSIDANGCEYEDYKTVYVWKDVWAPTGFTPNADEKNDLFRFYGGEFIDEFSFIIYNRLGQIVFEGHSLEDQWDGMHKGEPCPLGVYGWVANYKSNYKNYNKEGELRGHVTLMK